MYQNNFLDSGQQLQHAIESCYSYVIGPDDTFKEMSLDEAVNRNSFRTHL